MGVVSITIEINVPIKYSLVTLITLSLSLLCGNKKTCASLTFEDIGFRHHTRLKTWLVLM